MALTKAFYEAVDTNNVRRVRIMMKDSILVDPTFKEFKEMEMAAQSMKGLYDIHDGREFITTESDWDDNYMDKLMVQVVTNFSHERIEHLKDVVYHLRPVSRNMNSAYPNKYNDKKSKNKNVCYSYEEQKRRDQQEGRYLGTKIATGAIVGGVVGGVVASAVGVSVIGGAVTGAVIGGVAVSITVNGGKEYE